MKLDRVTLTGADDSVKAIDLLQISRRFPFVEWGILLGGSEEGCTRFPSVRWIVDELFSIKEQAIEEGTRFDLCAHLCGRFTHAILESGYHVLDQTFERSQINTHGMKMKWYGDVAAIPGILRVIKQEWDGEFIFQCDGENDNIVRGWVEAGLGVPLFDTSSGAGVLPSEFGEAWPAHWENDIYCGYAGGLGPLNVVEQISGPIREAAREGRIWIDMETKIFTKGQFDLKKCEDVLIQCEPYITTD